MCLRSKQASKDGTVRYIDASAKFGGYFSLPTVRHYLIIDPDKPLVIHHRRKTTEDLATRIINSGLIRLDPPASKSGWRISTPAPN